MPIEPTNGLDYTFFVYSSENLLSRVIFKWGNLLEDDKVNVTSLEHSPSLVVTVQPQSVLYAPRRLPLKRASCRASTRP